MISRAEIYWTDLGPPSGSRPAKRRPVLVIQSDPYNASRLSTVVAAVVWHGTLSHDDVTSRFLPTLDVFVLPTKHEVFGLAVLEAAGAGVPVVTSRMAAMPELVANGRTGFLCEPGDERCFVTAVERLLSDPAQRASMAAAARRHIEEHFNPRESYPRLFGLLAEIADPRRSAVAHRSAESTSPSAPDATSS